MKELIAKRKELEAKNAIVAAVFKAAGSELDFSKVTKIGAEDVSEWSTSQKTDKLGVYNKEIEALGAEVDSLAAAEKAAKKHQDLQKKMKHPADIEPDKEPDKPAAIKGLMEAMKKAKDGGYWEAFKNGKVGLSLQDVYPTDWLGHHVKTLFQTSAGWAPESIRLPGWVDYPSRPIQVIDILPMARTGQAAIVYMLETTRTHSAAEKAEAAAYAESAFALTETTSTVRKITDSIPVTDEQLDDVPAVESYLQNRLTFGVRQRLDGQVLTGNGVAPNLLGVLNFSSIQSQAKGADPTPDAVYKAMVAVRVTGRAVPNYAIFHPNDWQDIRLLRTSDGIYIWGNPADAGPMRIWGIPVVETDAETENTGLVGDFANFTGLFERKGVEVEVGYVDDDFAKGKKTLRAQMRVAFVGFRDTAFCKITGI